MARALLPLLALAPALVAGCSRSGFPEGFAFGAAVAGFQVDMGCPTIPAAECEDRRSDWYHFVTSTVTIARSSNFLSGDPVSMGPGFYELFEQDFDRMQAMGLTHFRFSVEWSRVFPESTVGIEGHEALKARASAAGLDYYRRQLQALRARNITPLVTLNHYTLPEWIHDAVGCNRDLARCSPRGWLEPHIGEEIAKFSGFVARELGDLVDRWATQNEPFAVVLPGYLQPTQFRTNPPSVGIQLDAARTALFALIRAHGLMYDAVKESDTVDADGDGLAAEVGLVYAVAPVHPKDPNKAVDRRAANNVDHLLNGVFLDAIAKGILDERLDRSGERAPNLENRLDFLGVNYYFRVVVEGEDESIFPTFSPLATFNPLTVEQGDVYPRGMYETLMMLTERYPGLPLVITENGVDVNLFADTTRFLVEHLGHVERAREDGADVRGYYYWSLVDNYEWNHGMAMQFGLFAVDPLDPMKRRTPRPVVDAYARIVEERAIPADLAGRYPIAAE